MGREHRVGAREHHLALAHLRLAQQREDRIQQRSALTARLR